MEKLQKLNKALTKIYNKLKDLDTLYVPMHFNFLEEYGYEIIVTTQDMIISVLMLDDNIIDKFSCSLSLEGLRFSDCFIPRSEFREAFEMNNEQLVLSYGRGALVDDTLLSHLEDYVVKNIDV